ncbi:MAG: metallophosphoesterase family protein [Thermomicrobiales bacterium]
MNRLKPTKPLSFLLVLAIIFIPAIAVTAALAANQMGYCVNAVLPGGDNLNARPYLLQVGSESAQIRVRWTVAQPATIEVTADGQAQITQTVDAAKLQTFDLTGLTPGTDYTYTVERAGSTWEGTFRTPSGREDSVRFDVLGSSGVSNDAQHAIADRMVADQPDFVLHTGDVVFPRGALCHYGLRYFGPYENLLPNAAVIPAIGEIDLKSSNGSAFRESFLFEPDDPLYRSFDYGPVHVVVLDSRLYEQDDQSAIDSQRAWLEDDLAASAEAPWTVVVVHRPPYSSTEGAASEEIRADLDPIFVQHGVDLVLSGHARNYERFEPDGGVTYVVTGGGGADTQGFEANRTSVAAADVHHVLSVDASPSEMTVRVIDENGATIDTFSLHG